MSGRGLLVDFGGVLTPPITGGIAAFEQASGLPEGLVHEVIAEAYADGDDGGPIGLVERGEVEVAEFERLLAARFADHGHRVEPSGLVARLFGPLVVDGGMWEVVDAARRAGVRTCLLSNSWGTGIYDHDRLAAIFDALVISAEVGVRKPQPAIFEIAAERIGVGLEGCAFVDDLPQNVRAAEALGIHGVHHTGDTVATARSLSTFLEVDLVAAVV